MAGQVEYVWVQGAGAYRGTCAALAGLWLLLVFACGCLKIVDERHWGFGAMFQAGLQGF